MTTPLTFPLRGSYREQAISDAVAILQPVVDRWRPHWHPDKVRLSLAIKLHELHQHLSIEQCEALIAEAGERVTWPTILSAG